MTPTKENRLKGTPTPKSGGIKKTKRRGKHKMEEPQRMKMELAMKNFLMKKPPEKQ